MRIRLIRTAILIVAMVFGLWPTAYGQKMPDPTPSPRMEPRTLPGMKSDGRVQLPNQWSLKPAGKQLVLGDFPANLLLHPLEPYAAVIHSGYGTHEVAIIDLTKQMVVNRAPLSDTFWGLAFSPDGKKLYASGGVREEIHAFDFAKGYLSEHRTLKVGDPVSSKLIPCGITVTPNGETLFAACTWGHRIAKLSSSGRGKPSFIELPAESFPYTTLLDKNGERLFVSLWGAAAVVVIDLKEEKITATWPTHPPESKNAGDHPTELLLSPDGKRLFVACANSNSVMVLDSESGKIGEILTSSLYPNVPVGSTPTSIALSANGKVLLIANSDNNNVAMLDVSAPGKAKSLGHIPVGWYPTAVRFGREDEIYVTNGKGSQSLANPHGPQPELKGVTPTREYIAGLMRGTLSIIPAPAPDRMGIYSQTSRECSPLAADMKPAVKPREPNNPIPAEVGGKSPIKHCIYLIKENRTYDQVLGDIPEGNGDPNLCLFPERVTPNQHALAREFVLLDNFYVESEVSADGHEWSMAAYATDFVERSWPLNYRGGLGSKIGYPSEGKYKIAASAGGYIWDRCKEAGISYRSYGEFVNNGKTPDAPRTAAVPGLEGHFAPKYHGYDLDYLDNKRVDAFVEELRDFEKQGNLPQFIVMRLPNNHTYGTRLGKPTPTAMVAENDLAFGRFVEAVSQSKFWPDTAIFVVEDDAQNGSDHVDAHRTIAFVISPYTKRKHVDSTMYSTSSMLRTMELILGLKPMSQFDAAATPMYHSFTAEPTLTPFKHRPANVDLNAVNVSGVFGAKESERMDFTREDAADDLLLNEVIWRSVRGPASKMPPPVRASFVRVLPDDEEEEEERREEALKKLKAPQKPILMD